MANSTSQSAAPRRPWYRLHASTWAVAGLVLSIFVILAVPAYREIPREPAYPSAVRGWPLVVLEQSVPTTKAVAFSNHAGYLVADEPERPQWLMASWWLYGGEIVEDSFSFGALAIDIALALAISTLTAAVLELRRRSRRSAWQFHITELLGVVLVVALCSAWFAAAKAAQRDEQAAVKAWENGFRYFGPLTSSQYVGPHWLVRLFGEGVSKHFVRTTNIEFDEFAVEDLGLFTQELPRFHFLNRLEIQDCPNIDLIFPGVSRSAPLSECRLVKSKVTLKSLQELQRHAGVRQLTFEECRIDDGALVALARLPRLESLSIYGEGLDDGNFHAIGQLVGLRKLTIHSADLNDERLAELSKLNALEALELCDTAITDASLPHLRSFTRLESLDLWGTQVSPQGIAELQKSLPNAEILGPGSADKSKP